MEDKPTGRPEHAGRPRGHAWVEHAAPPGLVTCQICGCTTPESGARRACYQCAYDGKPGFACGLCGSFSRCPDCENTFCGQHADPKVHVRAGGRNVLDTCSKRTACLMRVLDGVAKPPAGQVNHPGPATPLRV